MLTEAQLAMRLEGVTATDVSAIVGVNPFKSAHDVFLQKLDLVEPIVETEAMEVGSIIEPTIAELYLRREPGVMLTPITQTFQHPKKPWMMATPDRKARKSALEWLLELKNVGIRMAHLWGEEETDEAPDYVLTQCTWQLAVLEMERCDIGALIGGNQFRRYQVERNLTLEKVLIERAEHFWFDCVKKELPPPADSSEACKKALAKIYPTHLEDYADPTADLITLVEELKLAKIHAATAKEKLVLQENKVKELIADKAGVETPAGKVTWKKSVDVHKTYYQGAFDSLCEALDIPAPVRTEAIHQNTKIVPGSRRFVTPRSWLK